MVFWRSAQPPAAGTSLQDFLQDRRAPCCGGIDLGVFMQGAFSGSKAPVKAPSQPSTTLETGVCQILVGA